MNHGTINFEKRKNAWRISCAPHVALRIKRVFGKIDKKSQGDILLSNTAETCRDLVWFMERYPLTVETGRDELFGGSQRYEEGLTLVQKLLDGSVPPPPFELAVPLRNYQSIAAAVAFQTHGLLIADDVGLGKTAEAIGTFVYPDTLPAVVVTLTHLPRQWRDQIKKFAPHLRVHIVTKGTPYDLTSSGPENQLSLTKESPDVVILNYHKLGGWADTLSKFAKTVIYDEIQELRRDESGKYSAAHHLSKSVQTRDGYLVGLSATPIYNYGSEIYNVVTCLREGALGKREEFIREWCNQTDEKGKERIKNPIAFGTYMRESGLMLRRTREDVQRELPPIVSIPHYINADPAALERVGASAAELATVILGQGEAYRGQKMHASEELSNLVRQATGIGKAPYVAEFVRLIVESGEKVVLYGWHREVYTIWLDKLKDLNPVMYTGSESPRQKEESKQAFLSGNSKVLLMSLRAGAGLDGLQGCCRTVVFGELDWSPAVHTQAIGRVGRDGQTREVFAYYLIAETGSDPIVCETNGIKQLQSDGLLAKNEELFTKLQTDGGHIKRLAQAYLGKIRPEQTTIASIDAVATQTVEVTDAR